jgi:2-polyprenyl-3-methyl-5-hydroxy-6-metoxy-1,4-benzoquinol methylase
MVATANFLESSRYSSSGLRGAHGYLLPSILSLCHDLPPHSRILDVGCGNGSVAREFVSRGQSVVGIDLAEAGIQIARESCSEGRFEVLAADRNVLKNLGEEPFDLVYSAEVVEHLYDPRSFIAGCFAATRPQGRFICTTPYHGYWKNMAISVTNGWDKHADPLFDGGHIKLFSRKTLSALIVEAGFRDLQFRGAGRYPYLWKSMVIACTRP